MTKGWHRLLGALCAIAAVLSACNQPAADRPAETSREFPGRGIVRAVNLNAISIEHPDIPGFKPPSTSSFNLKDPAEATGLQNGDAIEFKIADTGLQSWVSAIRKIESAGSAPATGTETAAPSALVLKEGDALPEFVLHNERGERLTRETYSGKTLLITFVYTHCPPTDSCLLMARNFAQMAQRLDGNAELAARVRLLAISFDPVRDSPEVLTSYRSAFDTPRELFQVATGSPAEIRKLCQAFSVSVREENGILSHNFCTAMIDPAGRIVRLIRDDTWKPDDILAVFGANIPAAARAAASPTDDE